MGIFESITHKNEIESILKSAEEIHNKAISELESMKLDATNNFEQLGKAELKCWTTDISEFVRIFSCFANFKPKKLEISFKSDFINEIEPETFSLALTDNSMNVKDFLKTGTAIVGTTAIVSVAAFGAVSLIKNTALASAASISWASKSTLKLASNIFIGGIAIAPLLIIGTKMAKTKGEQRLVNAKAIKAEAIKKSKQINHLTKELEGILTMSQIYKNFIFEMSDVFISYSKEIDSIRKKYQIKHEKINVGILTDDEQKKLHIYWLLAQLYAGVLKTPILEENGKIRKESTAILCNAMDDLNNFENKYQKELDIKIKHKHRNIPFPTKLTILIIIFSTLTFSFLVSALLVLLL